MSQPGTPGLSRRSLLRLSASAGAGLVLVGCDVGGKASSGTEGSGEGKINALFMKQAGYSEDDIRAMTADFTKANPKHQGQAEFVPYEALHDKIVAAGAAGTRRRAVRRDLAGGVRHQGLRQDVTRASRQPEVGQCSAAPGPPRISRPALGRAVDSRHQVPVLQQDMLTRAGGRPSSRPRGTAARRGQEHQGQEHRRNSRSSGAGSRPKR